MKPPNHRDDMGLSETDLDFMDAAARSMQTVERTLQDIHLQNRLKHSLKELRNLIELLGETNRPEAAAYIQTAQDSVDDCLEEMER